MSFALICSSQDLAGINIRDSLLDTLNFTKEGIFYNHPVYKGALEDKQVSIYTYPDEIIHFESADIEIIADYFIFLSKHKSKSNEKSLTVHPTGNFSDALYGGSKGEFSCVSASLFKQLFRNLTAFGKDSGYNVTLEATHHGPLTKTPSLFIEIGSLETEWADKNAGSIVTKSIIKTIKEFSPIRSQLLNSFSDLSTIK